ncbi:MAG: LapA family protein [Acidimicrobiia bacterium]|nr:MAG: LapA family protein [Acidimicrobiia bacterium]
MERETSIWESRRFRVGLIAGTSALVALILILQNFDTVEVQFFFWRAEAPLAGLIFTSMLVGAGLQALIRLLWRRKRRHQDRDEQA